MRITAARSPLLLLSIFFILFTSVNTTWGDDLRSDCERQFSFAESLFEESDFYRAISEYKRLIFICPDDKGLCEKAYYKIGLSYFMAKRWEEARNAFNVFLNIFPNSSMLKEALYFRGMSEKSLSMYREALTTFAYIIAEDKNGEYRSKASYESAMVLMDMEQWDRAGDMFSTIPEESILHDSAKVFSEGIKNIDNIPHKSPVVGGTLAAVIPGSGHLYTNRPMDALVAFLLNGAFIWSAIELFDDEKYVTGGIVTFFELGWYSGNIYSAVSNVHKYNKRTRESFLEGLRNRANVSYMHNPDHSCNGIMLSMKF